jgi:hypothetical protein
MVVTEEGKDIRVTRVKAGIRDIQAMVILVILFSMAILVTIVIPAIMGTWDTRVILVTEVWGTQ